jgi:hypothetical protein
MKSFSFNPFTGNFDLISEITLGTANGLSLAGQVLSLGLSSTSTTGALSSTDWNTFNSKQNALTIGNLTDAGTDGITVTGGTGAVIGSGTSISQHVADSTHNGYLSSADWSTFNGKQAAGNYITALTGDATASGPGSAALTLATVNSNVGSFGSASSVSAVTVNAKGLVTAAASTSIQIAESQVTNLVSDLAGKQATGNYITALTGDVSASGPGSAAATLATVNSNVGSFTNANITVNAKGLITAASNGSGGSSTAPTLQKFLSTGTTAGYLFTVSSANATVGATYTNNSITFTVLGTIAAGTQLFCSSSGAPVNGSGTLTKASGTGDSSISFSTSQTLAVYTTPSGPSPLYLKISMVGGGGGGGGGTSAGNGGAGGSGTITAFGANILVANGGVGGSGGSQNTPNAGGTATIGTGAIGVALTGACTGLGQSGSVTVAGGGGQGGSSPFGGAGSGGSSDSHGPLAAVANTGSGGGGGGCANIASSQGGWGGAAGGYISAIINSPAGTYYYSVGAGGAAGSNGTSGSNGAAGGSGLIVVEEHYQ